MTMVFGAPGRYVQAAGEIARLGEHVAGLGRLPYLILDSGSYDRLGEALEEAFGCEGIEDSWFEVYDGPCNDRSIEHLVASCREESHDVVVGIGGGRMLDIAKAVAHYVELPLCVAPTVASTDAPCSALSVIYNAHGTFGRYLHLKHSPDLVVVDTAVVAGAPLFMTVAGMGDALATYFEARACAAAGGVNELGAKPGRAALVAARACYDTLMDCGVEAKRDIEAGKVTDAVERIVECNILLSGIGFESGGLALAHAIANGLTSIPELHIMHGNAVAYGLNIQLALEDAPEREQVLDFCHAVGLPTTLEELGAEDAAPEELASAVNIAFSCTRNIANEPVDVTPEILLSALN